MTPDEWEHYADMKTVVPETPYDQSRWSTYYTSVVQDEEGRFWELNWESGSTEQQDMPFEYCYHEVTEVFPKEVTKIEYVREDQL